MREILGWVCGALSIICGFIVSAKQNNASPPQFDTHASVFDEHDMHKKLAKDPIYTFVLWIGVALAFLSLWLLGMFGK